MQYFLPCTAETPCGIGHHAYTHRLNPSNIEAFKKFAKKWASKKKPISYHGLKFTHSQLCTWQILKHWGIIRKVEGELFYEVTPLGMDFYNGIVQLYDTVGVIGDEAIPYDHEAWLTHRREPQLVYISEIDETGYKKREEYLEEAGRQTSIYSML